MKLKHPFEIDAMVALREHLHCIWTLPDHDADFSMRRRLIKSDFSRGCADVYKRNRTDSRVRKGEQAVWQRRFWEHQIRDEQDFAQHVDYIHYNPVSHGLVAAPSGGLEGLALFQFSPLCTGWLLSLRLGCGGRYSIPPRNRQ